ncbi:PIN domain-containing protein [Shewanella oncorhynchi]|uniref:PIN domain-containing protein n=1 Tax=Shewanella oncorhynchi TaxID=2726434 RepID=UPI003D7980CF
MEDIELDYGAITIDNASLKGEGYRFYEGILKQMRQFKDSPVQVIQTDIVHNEAIKHIGQEISNTRSSIERALRSANKQLRINSPQIEQARELLTVEGEESEIADQRLNKYYEWIGGEVIYSSDYADLSLLMKLYFETEAPFEEGKDKKNEFPDAIALLSIEGWAEENDLNVIAVSQDKGWANYSKNSVRVTVVSSLSAALEKFQPHNEVANIIASIREDSLLDEPNHILEKITSSISDSLDGIDIDVDASSSFYYEYDVYATYHDHNFETDENDLVKVHIIRIKDESITLKVTAIVECVVHASFDFSIRDSIDKDYVGMGGSSFEIESLYKTDVVVTLSGDFSKGIENIDAEEIEVMETLRYADFGEVEPDWRSYEDEL